LYCCTNTTGAKPARVTNLEQQNMNKIRTGLIFATACAIVLGAGTAAAQQKGALVCWKDKAGKTVGCGDKVPPEYQDNANRVLNQRGVTVNQADAALTAEQRQAQNADAEQKKAEAKKREETARRDRALLDSFTEEKEIDLKRARDIQQIEINISAQQSNIKSMTERQNELRVKIDEFKKTGKPAPAPLQQEFDKLTADIAKNQTHILEKRKEIVEKNQEYDAMKKRFIELKGGSSAAAAPAAPAKK